MSLLTPERLYQLLPAVHRLRDAAQGEPLRALLGVIEAELTGVEAGVAALYDDWFIETCAEWVVPYIGDLLGARPIRPVPSAGVSVRGWVAHAIACRRRKGTARVLEQAGAARWAPAAELQAGSLTGATAMTPGHQASACAPAWWEPARVSAVWGGEWATTG